MRRNLTIPSALCAVAVITPGVRALPALQLYIEGATYDPGTETWVTMSNSFNLWVIGAVEDFGTISDVKLAAAYFTGETGSVSLTPTTSSYGGLTDLSTPSAPTATAGGGDGAIPIDNNNDPIPAHGVYGAGVSFLEWELGDFNLTDSSIGDFQTSFPTLGPKKGQVNVYEVSVSGFESGLHFDAFNHYFAGKGGQIKYVFAPFSHDGEGVVPAPGAALLGVLGLGMLGWVKRRQA